MFQGLHNAHLLILMTGHGSEGKCRNAKIGFGLLNTVGHRVEGGADVPWLNFFIAGEGFHKQHHLNFRKVRLHKWDTAGWIAEKLFVKG